MNGIQLYHPNSQNKGFCCSFSQSPKDQTIYATILKQSNWNAEKKIGSFSDSRNDPTKNVSIKLAQVEVAAILDCLDRNRPFSSYHDSDKQGKSILFGPWLTKPAEGEKPLQKGFTFSVNITDKQDSTAKNALYIGLTFSEGRLIREYLIHCLQKAFSSEIAPPVQVQESAPPAGEPSDF
jgi:hypothetical protein